MQRVADFPQTNELVVLLTLLYFGLIPESLVLWHRLPIPRNHAGASQKSSALLNF